MFIDGRWHAVNQESDPASAYELPFSYYGTILMDALPPVLPPTAARQFPWLPSRAAVVREEPVTPWIFPLDFVAEVAMQAFSPPTAGTAVVSLPENPTTVVPGFVPAVVEDLGKRARRARTAR